MAKITLKPLDDGQRPVEIPVGKTTIGRGPFLGCSDKKVSRNHAVLEVTNKGEVFLTPTHVNPCFYQPTADSPGQILKKDIPHKLENGDSFSLLPRAFRYQLIVTGENEEKKDQNDLNKQSGKTNGSAAECEEAMLNERNKDAKSGKGLSNEELNDANTVTEKVFSKDDDILANIDKNYCKEDNTFAKKIPDIADDKSQSTKDSKESKEDKSVDKDTNFSSKQDTGKDEKLDSPDDEKNKDDISGKSDSKVCESEDKLDDKPKFSEKVIEENESTLGNDAFSKDKTENDHLQSSEKSDFKNSQEKLENKKSDNVSARNGDENLDSGIFENLESPKGYAKNSSKCEDFCNSVSKENFDDTTFLSTIYLNTSSSYQDLESNKEIIMTARRGSIDVNVRAENIVENGMDKNVALIEKNLKNKAGSASTNGRNSKQENQKIEEIILENGNGSPKKHSPIHYKYKESIPESLFSSPSKSIKDVQKVNNDESHSIGQKTLENSVENSPVLGESIEETVKRIFEKNIIEKILPFTTKNIERNTEEFLYISDNDVSSGAYSQNMCVLGDVDSPSKQNLEETDEEGAPTESSIVNMKSVDSPEVTLSKELPKPTQKPKSKTRKRKLSEPEGEKSELKELINSNKKIQAGLQKISEEIKRQNDLREEALQIKRKKLKLLCLSANVKEDSLE